MKIKNILILLLNIIYINNLFSQLSIIPKLGISFSLHQKIKDDNLVYYLTKDQSKNNLTYAVGISYNLNSQLEVDYSFYYNKNNVNIESRGFVPHECYKYKYLQNILLVKYRYKIFSIGIGGSINSQFKSFVKPVNSNEYNSFGQSILGYGLSSQVGVSIRKFHIAFNYNHCLAYPNNEIIEIFKPLKTLSLMVGYQLRIKFKNKKATDCPKF